MRKDMHSPAGRRALVVELIEGGLGTTQAQLVHALKARGVEVTQATLSRDLKELGALKGPDGYHVPGSTGAPLATALGQWLLTATPAQNLLVLKTPTGGASPLAVALDTHGPNTVVGSIAGDDTVLVIAPTAGAARKLATDFARHARGAA